MPNKIPFQIKKCKFIPLLYLFKITAHVAHAKRRSVKIQRKFNNKLHKKVTEFSPYNCRKREAIKEFSTLSQFSTIFPLPCKKLQNCVCLNFSNDTHKKKWQIVIVCGQKNGNTQKRAQCEHEEWSKNTTGNWSTSSN